MSMRNEVNLNYMKGILEVADRRAKVTGKDIFWRFRRFGRAIKVDRKRFLRLHF